jgi:sodium/potassium-transporting ATPase subunit alpha
MFVGNAIAGLDNFNTKSMKDAVAIKQLVAAAGLCNNAHFETEPNSAKNVDIPSKDAIGDATDIALLRFSHQHSEFENLNEIYRELVDIPFNSRNKWMMKLLKPENNNIHNVIFGHESSSQSNLMLIKGAPDILLRKCNKIIQTDGHEIDMTDSIINQIIRIQNEW